MVDLNDAINIAKEALTRAYAPYSNYKVGAALVSKNDKITSYTINDLLPNSFGTENLM